MTCPGGGGGAWICNKRVDTAWKRLIGVDCPSAPTSWQRSAGCKLLEGIDGFINEISQGNVVALKDDAVVGRDDLAT